MDSLVTLYCSPLCYLVIIRVNINQVNCDKSRNILNETSKRELVSNWISLLKAFTTAQSDSLEDFPNPNHKIVAQRP